MPSEAESRLNKDEQLTAGKPGLGSLEAGEPSLLKSKRVWTAVAAALLFGLGRSSKMVSIASILRWFRQMIPGNGSNIISNLQHASDLIAAVAVGGISWYVFLGCFLKR